jgi:CBS domain-containing protein
MATVAQARAQLEAGGHNAVPLVDGAGHCVGIVTRSDLLARLSDDAAPVAGVASRSVVSIRPDNTLLDALEAMLDETVDHLPVVDGDRRLIGMCTRTDILRGRGRHLAHDRRQPGWQPRMRRARRHA